MAKMNKAMLGEYYIVSLRNAVYDNPSDKQLLDGKSEIRMKVVGFTTDKKFAYGTIEYKGHYISIKLPNRDIKKYSRDQIDYVS